MSKLAKESALIVMHCQNDIVMEEGLYSGSGAFAEVKRRSTLEKIAEALKLARESGMLVVYINNAFRPGYPELKGNCLPICTASRDTNSFLVDTWGTANPDCIKPAEGDIVMINHNTSAFSYTNLDQILRAQHIEKLFLAGVATNFVVDSTARYGSELGYEIHVLEDCCASWTKEMHEFEVKNILPQFGTVEALSDLEAGLKA
jgi:nicotinamidase-related amidase